MTAKELHDKIMSSSYEDGLEAIKQYAAEVSRESHETFMKTLDIKEDRKAIRKLRRFIIQLKKQEEQ